MRQFEKYYLKDNPFDIFSYVHKMANRKEEWQAITGHLLSAFRGRGPKFFILQGDYGMGKTYILEQIHKWVSEQKPEVFVVYGNVLYGRRLAVLETEPKWAKFGLDFTTRVFDSIGKERLVQVVKKANLGDFTSDFLGLFKGLKANKVIAFKYLTGAKLGAKDFDELKVGGPLVDSPAGLELLLDFLRVIKLGGYSNFLLLLDEFEYIPVLGEKKVTQILNVFREIWDNFGDYDAMYPNQVAKPIFTFATSPGGWERLKDLEESARKKTGGGGIAPFMERVSPRMIRLKPFSIEDTMELVKLRISEVRSKKLDDPFFPFTERCIEYVHRVSFFKPRNVLQYCGTLLEDALNEGLGKIDAEDADRILRKYGVTPTESETSKLLS